MASYNLDLIDSAQLKSYRAQILKFAELLKTPGDRREKELLLHNAILLYASHVSQNYRFLDTLEQDDAGNPSQRCGEEILSA